MFCIIFSTVCFVFLSFRCSISTSVGATKGDRWRGCASVPLQLSNVITGIVNVLYYVSKTLTELFLYRLLGVT